MRIQAAGRWLALALLGIAGVAGAAQPCGPNCEGNWVAAWGTAQQLVHPVRAIPAAVTPPARVARQTVRMVARPTVSGSALRVALSNSFGYAAVRIDAAHVGRHVSGGAIDGGSGRSLTFGGRPWVVVPPGAQVYSDPLPFEQLTVADITTGYQLLIQRARLHGMGIIGGTLTPFEGVPTYSEAAERMRQQVNEWIRTSGAFDAVVDFDAVTRDPAAPTKLRAEYDSGDHIHPNDAGNKAMADAIDLKLFR